MGTVASFITGVGRRRLRVALEAVRIRQMRLGVICGFVVFVLLASASFSSPGVTTNAKAAQVDFHMGFLEAVDYLNPFRGLNDPSYELYGLIYDYLFSLDQDGHPIPNIATDASCDLTCRNWTYTIRQGVKWSDGTDLTADDVAFTVNYNIQDRKSTRLNSSHANISYAVFCLKKKTNNKTIP